MSFASDIASFAMATEGKVSDVRKKALTRLSGTLIQKTPYGMPENWVRKVKPVGYRPGRLRGNWNASIGSPNYANKGPVDKTGRRTARKARRVAESLKGDDTYYLTNSVPYAYRNEFIGYPVKGPPPRRMVGLTMADAKSFVRRSI